MSLLRWLCGASRGVKNKVKEIDEEKDTKNSSLLETKNKRLSLTNLQFISTIGNGTFGKVYLAKDSKDGTLFAVKVMSTKTTGIDKQERHQMLTEHKVLSTIDNPFIVRLHYAFQTVDRLYLVMDFVSGGELHSHLKRVGYFPESKALFYSAELTSALGYLHKKNIIYRDLKPENVLINSEGHLVLIDFGLCKENQEFDSVCQTICGTSEYLAPEIIQKLDYTRAVDWWCLGIVLYEMLYGQKPFYNRDILIMYDNIVTKPVRLRDSVSSSARDILQNLLQKDFRRRLGSGPCDVEEVKCHKFFKRLNWSDVENQKLPSPYKPSKNSQIFRHGFQTEHLF